MHGFPTFFITKKRQQGKKLKVLFNLFSVMSKVLSVFLEKGHN